jgi:3',5'-cyclic AMP phosphodiesterase CpdA
MPWGVNGDRLHAGAFVRSASAALPAARLRDLAGKRALGYLNWTRNRHKYHRREVLDALVADMQAQRPDHVAVTGDLVNLALDAEFKPAQAWLKSVGAPQHVTVVPGNHDAYVRATRHRFAGTFGDYLRGDAEADGTPFPFVRRRGPLTLVGVSSAVPTAPLMATGKLGRAQLDALDRTLAQLSSERAFRVLLVHHPLHSDSRIKRLTDSRHLRALLKRHGVQLVPRARPHSFDDVVRRFDRRRVLRRRAVGVALAPDIIRAGL